jgi:hypothetical protein
LAAGEKLFWARNANREQSSFRQAGGKLFLTDRRIIFVPHRFDESTGGKSWSRDLKDIAGVAIEPSSFGIPIVPSTIARFRRRLRIEERNGPVELFVVNRVAQVASSIRDAAGKPGVS